MVLSNKLCQQEGLALKTPSGNFLPAVSISLQQLSAVSFGSVWLVWQQLLSVLTPPVSREVVRSVSSKTESLLDLLLISNASWITKGLVEEVHFFVVIELKQSNILSSWKSYVQCLLCSCVGLEALRQRADGRDSDQSWLLLPWYRGYFFSWTSCEAQGWCHPTVLTWLAHSLPHLGFLIKCASVALFPGTMVGRLSICRLLTSFRTVTSSGWMSCCTILPWISRGSSDAVQSCSEGLRVCHNRPKIKQLFLCLIFCQNECSNPAS